MQELRLDQDNVAYVGISKPREEIFEDIYMELRDIWIQFHAAVSLAKSVFDLFLRYVQDCQEHGSLCSAYVIFKVIGTALGTIFSVMYANVVMIFLETPVVTKFINQLTVYKRLLDAIIIKWIGDT